MNTFLQQRLDHTLICSMVIAAVLSFALPQVLSFELLNPVKDLLNSLDGAGDALVAHKDKPLGGAVALVVVTVLSATLAPLVCDMFTL